jgi:hypothetical protein
VKITNTRELTFLYIKSTTSKQNPTSHIEDFIMDNNEKKKTLKRTKILQSMNKTNIFLTFALGHHKNSGL